MPAVSGYWKLVTRRRAQRDPANASPTYEETTSGTGLLDRMATPSDGRVAINSDRATPGLPYYVPNSQEERYSTCSGVSCSSPPPRASNAIAATS